MRMDLNRGTLWNVKIIRWLGSQERALSALRCNWRFTLDHSGNPSNGTGDEEAAKAKSFHKNL